MQKRFKIFFLILIIANLIYPEIRVTVTGLQFPLYNANDLKGLPRLIELLALSFTSLSLGDIFKLKKKKFFFWGMLSVLILYIFSIFKPHYIQYLRTGILIPILLFFSISSSQKSLTKPRVILEFFNIVVTISALIVILSAIFNWSWTQNLFLQESAQRYIGLGQSAPYQSFYLLLGISLNLFFIAKGGNIFLYSFFMMVIMAAVLLNGARTGYIILILLFLFYAIKYFYKNIGLKYILVSVLIIGISIWSMWDIIAPTLLNRTAITDTSTRQNVWSIALHLAVLHPIGGISDFFGAARSLGYVPDAHSQNGYFEMIFWGGFLSFISMGLFLYYIVRFISKYSKDKNLRILTLSIMLIYLLYNITEIMFASIQVQLALFIILGSIMYQTIIDSSEKDKL